MSILRYSFYVVCGLAVALSLSTSHAQRGRMLTPPGEAPGATGQRSDDDDDEEEEVVKTDLLENNDLSMFRGYKQEEIGDGWSVEDSVLHFDGSGGGDIITKETYDDFDLEFDWKVSEGGNSGVIYRVGLGDGAPYMTGIEYQVLDDEGHRDGGSTLTSASSLYALYPPSDKRKVKPAGSWNSGRIKVEGNEVTHYLNGRPVLKAKIGSSDWKEKIANSKFKDWDKFATLPSGHIAFQDHGDEVWFRSIRITKLDPDAKVASKDKDRGRRSNMRAPGNGNTRVLGAASIDYDTGGGDKDKKKEGADDDDRDDRRGGAPTGRPTGRPGRGG